MNSAVKKIAVDMFYDVASPYSWIGFEALSSHHKKWKKMDLNLQPLLLGAVLKANQAKPPSPNQAKFSKVELRLIAEYNHIPLVRPANVQHVLFEKGTLQPQRLLTAIKQHHPAVLESVSRELYLRIWSRDIDATKRESLKAACMDGGLSSVDAENVIRLSKSDEIKQKLKDTTNFAVKQGVFGTPTFIAHLDPDPVLLFGYDKLFLLAYLINEKWHGPIHKI
uniref:Glutathione S-transferase kappa n=1 Tax=Phallusia mammillata TaxID=59560 RepID=A0A6F9DEU7_9ASCI|nr:glutathione S-transferase kappa 1-like [Phallusia mammillata]